MQLPANLNVYAAAALFVIGAYLVATYVGLVVWTFRDIRSRTRDVLGQILAALLVAVFTLPGVLIYILLRPKETLAEEYERSLAEEAVLQDLHDRRTCPSCQRRIEESFVLCPYCKHQLRDTCLNCGELVDLDWVVCPYVGILTRSLSRRAAETSARLPGASAEPAEQEQLDEQVAELESVQNGASAAEER